MGVCVNDFWLTDSTKRADGSRTLTGEFPEESVGLHNIPGISIASFTTRSYVGHEAGEIIEDPDARLQQRPCTGTYVIGNDMDISSNSGNGPYSCSSLMVFVSVKARGGMTERALDHDQPMSGMTRQSLTRSLEEPR